MTTTRFQIEERGGLAGITLVVRIPEGDLDYKALRTIQGETPSFIIPFQSRQVDGDVELTYQLGSLNKLVYFCGSKPRDLYIDLWLSLINPLTRCDDWFMSHSSFLLDLDYIYYDNNAPRDAVKYLYVPSVRPCTDYAGLKQFVEALSQKISTTDPQLEMEVIKSIQTFNAYEFARMLKQQQGAPAPASPAVSAASAQPAAPAPVATPAPQPPQPKPSILRKQAPAPAPAPVPSAAPASAGGDDDDFGIQLRPGAAPEKKKGGLFGGKEKEPAAPKPVKEKKGGLFGRKEKPEKAAGSSKVLLGGAAAENGLQFRSNEPVAAAPPPPVVSAVPESEVTEVIGFDNHAAGTPSLRLVTNAQLPERIAIAIGAGQSMSIGRFDVRVGMRQNDFEFEKDTKAVSRRHAVIQNTGNGYVVLDLNSKAGTYINKTRILPNQPHPLNVSDTVAFGNAGAEYVFEV